MKNDESHDSSFFILNLYTMIPKTEREQIIALINREVVPAIGCTEPIAVALCVAKATETLGCRPEKIQAFLSANILKNAMGVGIPGTGMIGLPIAIALGALIGKSEYQLEVLKDSTPEAVEEGKKLIDAQTINISLKEGIEEKLYIEIKCKAGDNEATAIISGGHTRFVYISKNEEILLNKESHSTNDSESDDIELSLRKVYDFATTSPIEELAFILETRNLNKSAAERSFKGNYGHQLGKTLNSKKNENLMMGDNTFTHILSYTSAACDARMAGAMIPVMSNSGSGNQGITATLPVVVYAEDNHKSEEELIRALVLSHLTVIYIKQSLGRLSALCGCVVAATGSSCGITYLMGGNYEQITYAVKNMIANITGMICDGAKSGCAVKLASAASAAVQSAIIANQNCFVPSKNGIVGSNVEESIKNLGRVSDKGMTVTDEVIINVMDDMNKVK